MVAVHASNEIPSFQRKLESILLLSLIPAQRIETRAKIKMGPSLRWDDGIDQRKSPRRLPSSHLSACAGT
jgi:hypothetical protein